MHWCLLEYFAIAIWFLLSNAALMLAEDLSLLRIPRAAYCLMMTIRQGRHVRLPCHAVMTLIRASSPARLNTRHAVKPDCISVAVSLSKLTCCILQAGWCLL